MRRKDREQSRDFALKVTDNSEYGVLSMVDSYGNPYCVPLSMVRDGEQLYFHCASDGQKSDCLRNNRNVCVSCVGRVKSVPEEFTTEFESAIIKGEAFEVTDKEEKIHALRLICLKYAESNMKDFDSAIKKSLDRTAIWKITISEITGKAKIC